MSQDLHYDQIPIDFGFYTKKTLDNFVVGTNHDLFNSLSHLDTTNQLVLIYGAMSSGKSHICKAMMNFGYKDVLIINQETNLNKLIYSEYYNLLVIDDVDKIVCNHNNEEKLFSLVNGQILNKKSTVVTSTKNLKNCEIKLNDLSSRLLSDKIYTIHDLDDDDKINLMMSYCSERGLEISKKVLNYIMNNCSRDLYFLCAFIRTLDHVSLSMKKRVTIPFIKKAISSLTD
tara:strand:- start:493 stop:1182 length:690 start_codon:yes stop_codon:yes gene_type:complete